jgi:hypothetical protein
MALTFIIYENFAVDALSRLPTADTDQGWPCTVAKNGLFELLNSERGEAEPMVGPPPKSSHHSATTKRC